MIDLPEELCRLTPTRCEGGAASTPDGVVQVDVWCKSDASAVLDRAREVLGLAIRHRLEHPSDESEPGAFTVNEAYWATVLPQWFLDRTPFASADQPPDGWTVEGWLYWFLSAHEDRAWRWVSASVVTPAQLAVVIQVADLPLAWEALRWTLLAAGATSAEL